MAHDYIIEEAIRLVNEGVCVTLPVDGRSMLPFIIGGRESVILQKPLSPKVGDVVLAWVEGGRYVIHRIIRIEGENVTLMGDGNLYGVERCKVTDIKAQAFYVVNSREKRHSLDSGLYKFGAKVWCILKPIRKWLLLCYRVLEKVKIL